ncbi:MAG TPA: helix-turn-helix transcriptional regulator [Candidatus Deferrimicrobium sp.]|nr:helix-turn-helix transcriptional regulator [Candidatus Kapabacteria bacterium]HLP62374.1 helix-turn-helix transcriptional regulator [Candidatus Deferrimicrobium sp.]
MINIEEIGKRLRKVRESFNFTQPRMAEIIRVQDGTYKKNERGIHLVNVYSLDQLHTELGVSAEWLLFENGPVFWKDIQAKKDEKNLQKQDLFMEELEEMITIMKRIPMIRHSVMLHYQDCKVKHKDLIAEARDNGKF